MFATTPARHQRGVKNGGRLHRAIEASTKREQEAEDARVRQRQAEEVARGEAEIRRRLGSESSDEDTKARKVDGDQGKGGGYAPWRKALGVTGIEFKGESLARYGGCALISMLVVILVYWMGWL